MQGACIALPRYQSNGGPGLAGILCQGFDSGNACIWDSFLMGEINPIDWTSETTGTTNWIFRLASDGAREVGVGENGLIITSMDGGNWQIKTFR